VNGKQFLSRSREMLGNMRDRAAMERRRVGRGTLHLPNSEGTTGPRTACDDAKADMKEAAN
jgi:hypothetical protein